MIGKAFLSLLVFVLICEYAGVSFELTMIVISLLMFGMLGVAADAGSAMGKWQGRRRR